MLKNLLFESPYWIVAPLLIATLVVAWLFIQRRGRKTLILLLALPLVAIGLVVLATIVQTDREQVRASWGRVEQAAAAGTTPAVMAEISPAFSAGGIDRADLETNLQRAAERADLTALRFVLLSVQVDDDDDRSASAIVMATYSTQRSPLIAGPSSNFTSRWQVDYRKDGDGQWRIADAKSISPPGLNLRWALRQIK